MKELIVIVGYKPKPGQEEALKVLMRTHLPTLQQENLVTERPSIMMESKDGTIIEVFEWKSQEAIDQAHTNPAVLKMWTQFGEVCDYIPVGQVAETESLFSQFKPFH